MSLSDVPLTPVSVGMWIEGKPTRTAAALVAARSGGGAAACLFPRRRRSRELRDLCVDGDQYELLAASDDLSAELD